MREAIQAIQEDWSVRRLNMARENEREEERGIKSNERRRDQAG